MRELTTNEVEQISGGGELPGGQSPLSIFADQFPLTNAALSVIYTGVTGRPRFPPGSLSQDIYYDQLGQKYTVNPLGSTTTDQLGNQHPHNTYTDEGGNVFGRF
ncbi:MAG: hypothetical protein V3U75_09825 [Methylococcaceae bacterium]